MLFCANEKILVIRSPNFVSRTRRQCTERLCTVSKFYTAFHSSASKSSSLYAFHPSPYVPQNCPQTWSSNANLLSCAHGAVSRLFTVVQLPSLTRLRALLHPRRESRIGHLKNLCKLRLPARLWAQPRNYPVKKFLPGAKFPKNKNLFFLVEDDAQERIDVIVHSLLHLQLSQWWWWWRGKHLHKKITFKN